MKSLKDAFLSFQQQYYDRRAYFNDVFATAMKKGYVSFSQKGRQMMALIDDCLRTLETSAVTTGTPDALAIKEAKLTLYRARKAFAQLNEMVKPLWRQWLEAIVIAFFLAFILRNFVFGLYHVPTGSAETNILVGDRVWGNKAAYFMGPVGRGELVIFDNPEFRYDSSSTINHYWQKYIGLELPLLGLGAGPDNLVKRVIGIPGDSIEGKVENGKTAIYRNGKKLEEPYVNRLPLLRVRKQIGFIPFKSFGPFSIPQFLQKRYTEPDVNYTYDPDKPLDEQAYYSIEAHEVVTRPGTNQKIMQKAYDPIYHMSHHGSQHAYCVDVFGPITIPAGKYWVMGDSRRNSRDSRYWQLLDEKLIHGRASFVIFSIDSEEAFWLFELAKHPINFWTKKVRYNRFFTSLATYNGIQE